METENLNAFESLLNDMKSRGMKVPPEKTIISVRDSENILKYYMRYFIEREGVEFLWIEEYNEVAEWLGNNKGRGLFLYGVCGKGKTILSRYVIPAILLKYCNRLVSVFDINELNADIDFVLSKKIISLDDIGTEELSIKYGERRNAFAEVVDNAEKHGKLLIISSNLDSAGLERIYGVRVLDRITHITKRVAFNGKSFRR